MRGEPLGRVRPQRAAQLAHLGRRVQVVAHDVAHHEADLAPGQLHDVVPVAADLRADPAGQVAHRQLHARDRGEGVGQQALLQGLDDAPLAAQDLRQGPGEPGQQVRQAEQAQHRGDGREHEPQARLVRLLARRLLQGAGLVGHLHRDAVLHRDQGLVLRRHGRQPVAGRVGRPDGEPAEREDLLGVAVLALAHLPRELAEPRREVRGRDAPQRRAVDVDLVLERVQRLGGVHGQGGLRAGLDEHGVQPGLHGVVGHVGVLERALGQADLADAVVGVLHPAQAGQRGVHDDALQQGRGQADGEHLLARSLPHQAVETHRPLPLPPHDRPSRRRPVVVPHAAPSSGRCLVR